MRIKALVLLIIVAFTPGCIRALKTIASNYNREASDKIEQWGAFRKNQIYVTTRDLFLMDVRHYTFGPALTIGKNDPQLGNDHGGFSITAPISEREYKEGKTDASGVLGLVSGGTHIQIEELREFGNKALNRSKFYVVGRILEGEHSQLVVDLKELSDYGPTSETVTGALLGPDDDFLKLISNG